MAKLAKIRSKPRKIPRQERSREMVATILEAATRVLIREGYAHATTNKIAAAAGISVGSLYQYFPGKDALVLALMNKHREDMLDVLGQHLQHLRAGPLETAVPALIRAVLDAHGVNPKLHRVMLEQVLRSPHNEQSDFKTRVEAMVREALAVHKKALRVRSVDLAAFILVQLMVSVARTAAMEHPARASDDRLVGELSDVVLRYLLAVQPEI